MLFATADQGYVFLLMCAAGALTAAWYDLTALLRRLLEAGFWLSLAADAALGLGTACILGGAMLAANYGQPRLYMFLAAALGAALYRLGASRLLRGLLRRLKKALRAASAHLKDNRIIKVIFR